MKQLEIQNETIPVEIVRKKVKNLTMRILVNGTIQISAPLRLPEERIDEFILSKQSWIEKQRNLQKVRREHLSKRKADGPAVQLLGKTYSLVMYQSAQERFEIEQDRLILYVKTPERAQSVFEKQAKEMLEEIVRQKRIRLDRIMDDYRLMHPSIHIRKMKGKWGSCTPAKAKITLNLALIHTPMKCVEYVLIHEYMHMICPDHSKRFYGLIEMIMPEYKEAKKLLKEE